MPVIGNNLGVCKAANPVAVKVLTPTNDGTGRSTGACSWVMAGMAWGKFFMSSKELCKLPEPTITLLPETMFTSQSKASPLGETSTPQLTIMRTQLLRGE